MPTSLVRNIAGAATIELALAMPLLITMGMYGTEIAYMSSVNMQVSQLAMAVGDNASRIGQTDNSSVTPTVTEADINSVMAGAIKQGQAINFRMKGKVILSSLEKNGADGSQYIHWRRCTGDLNRSSSYQNATIGVDGIGTGSNKISALSTTSAVMFVEIFYRYDGLFGDMFVDEVEFKQEAAFLTRDDRNLSPGITGTGSTAQC